MTTIQAITFDLWETIIEDESDEPRRRAQGLRLKDEERRYLLWEAINQQETPQETLSLEIVSQAYDVADAAFTTVWYGQHVTWPIRTKLEIILRGLGRSIPPDALDEIVYAHEVMEVEIPPDAILGCAEAIACLSQRYKLAIVSDTIVTPGRCLRELLELHDVKKYFTGFAFSDEVGHSKPHRDMFASAAEQLGVPFEAMVHIGDREHTDIQGAHALGMKAILFTAIRSVDEEGNTADAVCKAYGDLSGIIDRLAMS